MKHQKNREAEFVNQLLHVIVVAVIVAGKIMVASKLDNVSLSGNVGLIIGSIVMLNLATASDDSKSVLFSICSQILSFLITLSVFALFKNLEVMIIFDLLFFMAAFFSWRRWISTRK
jgi:hypothetical protein